MWMIRIKTYDFSIWGFPEIEVPQIIHVSEIFHLYINHPIWVPDLWNPPHLFFCVCFFPRFWSIRGWNGRLSLLLLEWKITLTMWTCANEKHCLSTGQMDVSSIFFTFCCRPEATGSSCESESPTRCDTLAAWADDFWQRPVLRHVHPHIADKPQGRSGSAWELRNPVLLEGS